MWPFGRRQTRKTRTAGRVIRAKYDAAQTTVENTRHWLMADGLSADAAASADVRRTLRNRCRYEVANNSYARGIVLTLANDVVGTGPRLQMLAGDPETNRRIESAFGSWAAGVGLAGKLRTMRMAKAADGEAFCMLTGNDELDSPVKLDVQLVEADRVTNPGFALGVASAVDGIEYDAAGNARVYSVLRDHPGSTTGFGAAWLRYDRVPAEAMVHWFRSDRPGQHRGIPEITPALPLFAQLRRYTLAVLGAAETAADFAAVLYTDAPASGEAAAVEPMDIIELEKRMATVLPDGWKLGQIKAEQPGTAYSEFKREILNEIARCLNMPFNVAAGNSSGYNYASGRLDHQTYYKSIRVEQSHLQTVVLDRILLAWLDEASLIEGLLPQFMRRTDGLAPSFGARGHSWFWDGVEHVDPAKEANAQASRLSNHTTTLAIEYARQGRDWEEELKQRAREMTLMDQLGLSVVDATPDTDMPQYHEEADERAAA